MMIDSENKLLSIDETCLSELSEENESTISGGSLSLSLVGLLIGAKLRIISKFRKPIYVHPAPQPPVHPYEPPHHYH